MLGAFPVMAVVATFVLAGVVKGVTGMGLPTVAIGLLGLVMVPSEAAALLVIPSLVTNVWQFAAGPGRLQIFRRLLPMLIAIAVATWASTGLLTGGNAGHSAIALGVALVVYAIAGLTKIQIAVPVSRERWLSPLIGALTGVVTGATGVFVIPAVPYLQALGLEKEDLVQALGLSFTVSTIALAAGLASRGAFHLSAAGISLACIVPALIGMFFGQWIRLRVDAATFRLIFFAGLLLLGSELALRSVL